MKYKIANSNNLVAIAGRIGFITPKFDSLTNVSIANNLRDNETEWCYLNFSNPKNNFNGTNWADFANKNLKKGQFILTVCYEKQNGEYMNYYVNACNDKNLFYQIPNTEQIAVVGKVISITKKSDDLYIVKVQVNNNQYDITFMNTEKSHTTKFASKLSENQYLGCIVTKKVKGQYTNYYANAFEYGPKK
jgi:hypothetical protein